MMLDISLFLALTVRPGDPGQNQRTPLIGKTESTPRLALAGKSDGNTYVPLSGKATS